MRLAGWPGRCCERTGPQPAQQAMEVVEGAGRGMPAVPPFHPLERADRGRATDAGPHHPEEDRGRERDHQFAGGPFPVQRATGAQPHGHAVG